VSLNVGQSWDGQALAAWTNQSAPGRVREVDFDGKPCLALGCFDADVAPVTPNSNPRAQLVGSKQIDPGCRFTVDVSMLVPSSALPASWPTTSPWRWVEFIQFAYGPPYAGSPPLRIISMDGQTFGLRLADGPFAWSAPLDRDVWWRFVCELKMYPTYGWYRLSVGRDGQPPVEVVPHTQYDTMQASNNGGPNALYLDAYMAAGTADRIGPIYFTGAKVTRTA
jgi:hypothetical protein